MLEAAVFLAPQGIVGLGLRGENSLGWASSLHGMMSPASQSSWAALRQEVRPPGPLDSPGDPTPPLFVFSAHLASVLVGSMSGDGSIYAKTVISSASQNSALWVFKCEAECPGMSGPFVG